VTSPLFARLAGVLGQTFSMFAPLIRGGLTQWFPSSLGTATLAVVYSELFTGRTEPADFTAVQIGPSIPLPGSGNPGAPAGGGCRINYELDVAGEGTAVGASFAGYWAWSPGPMGTPMQTVAIGTNAGALPAGWSATLFSAGGYSYVEVTTDAASNYTCKLLLQWGYTE
jgi:hypothetical protein